MSRPGFSAPLRIEPGRSRLLAAALAAVHGVGVGVLLTLPWAPVLQASAAGLLALHGIRSLRVHVLRPAVQAAWWSPDGRWRLRLRGAPGWEEAQPTGAAFVTRHLAVLRFRLESGRRVGLLVLPDAVPTQTRRRLVLRWRCRRSEDA